MLNNTQKIFAALWHTKSVKFLLLPWATLFLILNLVNTQDGGPNAVSRFLTLRAMSEEATFRIDERIGATADWSQTPDGHYFSNKAPGPMLLGFPTFFVIDQIPRIWEKGFRDEHGQRHTPGYFQKTWTSFLNQIFPLIFICALILVWMESQGVKRSSQIYFLLAAFFGSTASMYFNNYSGHGFQAVLQLALLYALIREEDRWIGFLSGAALLADYEFVLQLPAFLCLFGMILYRRKKFLEPVKNLCIGAIIPGALWVWYHTSCFGSPFLVANHFQNPLFQDTLNEEQNFLGIFRMPNFTVLYELLFGQSRGLLFTQPWILFIFPWFLSYAAGPAAPKAGKIDLPYARKMAALFCGLSLIGLLFVNMSYGGWNGGGTAGPRYLSGIFLCFALWTALEVDRFPAIFSYAFWAALGVSIVFRALVYGSTILGPSTPLWQWYFSEYLKKSKTPHLRFAIFALLFLGAIYWQRKLFKKWDSAAARA